MQFIKYYIGHCYKVLILLTNRVSQRHQKQNSVENPVDQQDNHISNNPNFVDIYKIKALLFFFRFINSKNVLYILKVFSR